jgi:hypothetical protein
MNRSCAFPALTYNRVIPSETFDVYAFANISESIQCTNFLLHFEGKASLPLGPDRSEIHRSLDGKFEFGSTFCSL